MNRNIFIKLHANIQSTISHTAKWQPQVCTLKFDICLALTIPNSKPSMDISIFPKGHISLYCLKHV